MIFRKQLSKKTLALLLAKKQEKESKFKMQKDEKKVVVLAMEIIARNINDEDVFFGWLINGVADGDLDYQTIIEKLSKISDELVDDYYVEDDNYKELTECFLRRMVLAKKSGGLVTY